ncbi:MAG: nucleotidyl transferase AbiEii/AbiGii toxin family protein [Acidobacteriota bacterium]
MTCLEPAHDLIAPASRHILERLAERSWSHDLYLAGSAALSLYLGHRRVGALDLMGVNRLGSPQRRDLLEDILAVEPGVRVETARNGYLDLRWPAEDSARGEGELFGPAVRVYYYPYPLIDPEEDYAGWAVASAVDLGLMKLGAAASRVGRRDLVDLYLLTRRLPLAELLDRAPEKFGHVRDFPLQALKGLADAEQAYGEPLPRLEIELDWSTVESWLHTEVRAEARRRVGLDA